MIFVRNANYIVILPPDIPTLPQRALDLVPAKLEIFKFELNTAEGRR